MTSGSVNSSAVRSQIWRLTPAYALFDRLEIVPWLTDFLKLLERFIESVPRLLGGHAGCPDN